MVFFRKKRKEEDIKEIKSLVEGMKLPEILPRREMPRREERIEARVPMEEMKPVAREEEIPPKPPERLPIKEEIPVSKPVEKEEKPASAPLFVKIDKYRSVLHAISELRTTVLMIKNALGLQRQIESLREENRKLLEHAVEKVDEKISSLDSEFLKPRGFEEEFPSATYETGGLEGVVGDLKKQIESLKSELKTIS